MLSAYPKTKLSLIAFFYAVITLGQPAEELEKYRSKYPDAFGVNLLKTFTYNLVINADKLEISSEIYAEDLLLKSIAANNNEDYVTTSSFRSLKEIDAYTLIAQKKKYKKIPIKSFFESKDLNSSFHDDIVKKSFTYTQLDVGAKKCLKYSMNYTEPQFMDGFWFLSEYPIDKAIVKVVSDPNIELGFKVFNDSENQISFSKKTEKNKVIYTWQADSISQPKFEGKSPSIHYTIPHILFYIKSYKTSDGRKINVLSDLNDLYKYYNGFTKNLNKEKDNYLAALVDSITAEIKTEPEKAKAIYYWVKNNIKYIAIEDGFNGFVPRQARDIYQQRYGDCKDMSSITHEMLKYANIKNAYLTWIGSDALPYSYYEIPSPSVDNHMIVTYKHENEIHFLDATSRETPWGMPSSFIQGKEALVQISDDKFEVLKVPIMEAKKNLKKDSLFVSFSESNVLGKGVTCYSGYMRDDVLHSIYDHSGQEKQQVMKELLEKGNNKFSLINYSEGNKLNKDSSFKINYDFKIDNYAIFTNGGIYFNPFLEKPFFNYSIESSRKSPLKFDYNSESSFYIEISVPESYKIKSLPDNSSFKNDLASFYISFAEKKGKIILSYLISVNSLLIKKEQFKEWNNFVEALNQKYVEVISFNKNN
jgi:transglutaminase-like putative cysteine protease